VPRAMHYNANSVVYFTGDMGDKIFILQSGKIILKTIDIETGEELTDLIRTGEFFGVKSALGHYPREEDAIVLGRQRMPHVHGTGV
jgi:CRP-like cAMP-binding protein